MRAWMLCWVVVLSIAGCADSSEPAERPNILWITVEDMGNHLGSWGESLVRTPNLDRLAEQGTRYTGTFATAPVCSAARTALITGMYQSSIGGHQHRANQSYPGFDHPPYQAVLPPEVKAFTEYLRAAGYYTTNNAKTDYNFGKPVTAWDESGGQAHWRNRPDPEQPFFSVFNSARTHESRVWPNPDEDAVIDRARVELPPYYPDTPIIREDYARMLDNAGRMDTWAGDLLDQLVSDSLADNTIVFFFTDHGDGIPRGKRWLRDSGLQTPMIIRWPGGLEPGSVDGRLISFIDLSATVLSLAGVIIPEHIQGRAFLGNQADPEPRAYIHAARDRMDESHDMRRAVRDHDYLYVRNFYPDRPFFLPNQYRDRMPLMQELIRLNESGELTGVAAAMFSTTKPEEELFDVVADPFQIHNLADDPSLSGVLERMRTELERWQSETGDMGLIPETVLSEMMWPGGVQPTTNVPDISLSTVADGSMLLRISCTTEGASIAFTTDDGENPAWRLYSEPVSISPKATVRAVAIRYGFAQSEVASARGD